MFRKSFMAVAASSIVALNGAALAATNSGYTSTLRARFVCITTTDPASGQPMSQITIRDYNRAAGMADFQSVTQAQGSSSPHGLKVPAPTGSRKWGHNDDTWNIYGGGYKVTITVTGSNRAGRMSPLRVSFVALCDNLNIAN